MASPIFGIRYTTPYFSSAPAFFVFLSVFFFFSAFPGPVHSQLHVQGDSTLVTLRVLQKGRHVADAEVFRIRNAGAVRIGLTGRDGAITLPLLIKYGRIHDSGGVFARIQGRLAGFTPISPFTDSDSIMIRLLPAQNITGMVRNDRGMPISGAEIVIWSIEGDETKEYTRIDPAGWIPGTSARSDVQGRFRLEGIPELSRVSFRTTAPGYASLETHDVPAGMDNLTIILDPESHFTGRTLTETGEPLQGICVHAQAKLFRPSSSGGGDDTTDTGGQFSFEHLSAGMYSIFAFPDSTRPELVPIPLENAGVGRGKTAPGVDIRFIRGVPLTGMVVESASGEPLPDIPVYAGLIISNPSERYTMMYAPLGSARTDAKGIYRLMVIPGDVQVTARSPEGFSEGIRPQRVTVENETEVKGVNLALTRGKTVRGTVRLPDGSPAADIEIDLQFFPRAYSDERGEFTLTGLQPGYDYPFLARSPKGNLGASFTVRAERDSAITVTLQEIHYVTVSGMVTDAKGEPVSGISVGLEIAEESSPYTIPGPVVSDSAGRFTRDRIPAGQRYRFKIRDGFAVSDVFLAGEDPGPFRIELPRADRWLEGTVKDTEGKPMPGIKVFAWGKGHTETLTDRNGRYRLNDLIDEKVEELTIRGVQGIFRFQNIPTNQRRDFILPTGRHYLSGKIIDLAGKTIAGALVRLSVAEGERQPVAVETDAKGCFFIGNLLQAEAQLTASGPGYSEKKLTVKNDREDVVVKLETTKK